MKLTNHPDLDQDTVDTWTNLPELQAVATQEIDVVGLLIVLAKSINTASGAAESSGGGGGGGPK